MAARSRCSVGAELTAADIAALRSVYQHRCLNEELLQKYFYADMDPTFALYRLRWFYQNGLVDFTEYSTNACADPQAAVHLTNRGIRMLRAAGGGDAVAFSRNGVNPYDLTAGKLKMTDRLLNHQMHLNALSLEIEQRCGLPQTFYKDCKFARNFTYAQPDGVFELPDHDFDLFLEMDMAHERVAALKKKWEHYRNYRASRDSYIHRPKRTIVLFATENIRRCVEFRRQKVIESLFKTIQDLLGDDVDCYIGPSSKMANVAEHLIPGRKPASGCGCGCEADMFQSVKMFFQESGAQFTCPAILKELTHNTYIYMHTPAYSFFVEDYTLQPMSALKKAATHQHVLSILRGKFQPTPLLLIAPSEDAVVYDLKGADCFGLKNVFFTTLARLKSRPIQDALFVFDKLGARYHFRDTSWSDVIFEKKGGR